MLADDRGRGSAWNA